MYKGGYVVAVIANGDVLEENEKRVTLPFGTEYKVRLINKNYEKCASDLIINGEKVARFIINPGETADIERFIDGNLNSGKKFQFTHLNDSRVKDKSDFENGMIEVLFFKEKKKSDPIVIEKHIHHWDRYSEPYIPLPPLRPYNPPIIWGDNTGGNSYKGGGTFNCCMTSNLCGNAIGGELGGATVRGSESSQSFSSVTGLEWEAEATIIKLKLVNGELLAIDKYCSGCGRKRKQGDKFCSSCGSKY